MATRQEHLDWCKQRANEYFKRGEAKGGIASFLSDIRKSDATADIANHPFTRMGAMITNLEEAKSFVNGVN